MAHALAIVYPSPTRKRGSRATDSTSGLLDSRFRGNDEQVTDPVGFIFSRPLSGEDDRGSRGDDGKVTRRTSTWKGGKHALCLVQSDAVARSAGGLSRKVAIGLGRHPERALWPGVGT